MDVAIQANLRARAVESADHARIGSFVLRWNPGWDSPYVNYAIPDDGAEPSAAEVAALVAAFRYRDRMPRLEYLPSCAPAVEGALFAAGFTVVNRAPVMACDADSLTRPGTVAGVVVEEPADDEAYLAAATVQHVAYGEPGEPGGGEVDWLRTTALAGGVVALVRTDLGEPVAAGVCSSPADGLVELAGLAVAAGSRRRGIGAALAAHLTATALERGCRGVWLEPGDADVQRIYARIGYRTVGEKVDISLR